MKKLTLIILLFTGIADNVSAQHVLRLINNTDKTIYSAYVHFSFENRCWISEGWFEMPAFSQKDVDMGDYTGKVYLHATRYANMGLSERNWGKGYSMCVDRKAFRIMDADKISCNNRGEFSELMINNPLNRFEFNP